MTDLLPLATRDVGIGTRILASMVGGALIVLAAAEPLPEAVTDADDGTIVITARRTAADIALGAQQVSSRTAAEIAAYSGVSPDDPLAVLARQPGLFVINGLGGGLNGSPVVSVRGTANGDTQILLDGIPFNDAATPNGQIAFQSLPGIASQRVDILKGSQPIYGTKAVGGVINYHSLRPTNIWQGQARLAVGNFQQRSAAASVAGPLNQDWGLAVSASGYRAAGVSAQTDAGSPFGSNPEAQPGDPLDFEDDHFRRGDATARLEHLTDNTMFYLSGIVARQSVQFDTFLQPDDAYSKNDTTWWRLAGGGEVLLSETVQVAVDAAYTRTDRQAYGFSFPPPDFSPTPGRTDFAAEDFYASARVAVALGANIDAVLGIDTLEQSVEIPNIDERANLTGAHLQLITTPDNWTFDGTARFEEHSDAGSVVTWRLGVAYQVPQTTSEVFASAASGFRAPSLFDLYDPSFGNPDLQPQENLSYDLGHRTSFGPGFTLSNTFFYIDYTDLISFDPITFQSINIDGDSHSIGVENSLRFHPNDGPLHAELSYTWNEVKDNDDNTPSFRPENIWGLQVGLDVAALNSWLAMSIDHIDKYQVFGSDVDGYTLFGAVATYAPHPALEVSLRVRNLFDAVYEPQPGFTGTPRSILLGVQATY